MPCWMLLITASSASRRASSTSLALRCPRRRLGEAACSASAANRSSSSAPNRARRAIDVGIEMAEHGAASDQRRDDARALRGAGRAGRAVAQARATRAIGLVEPRARSRRAGPMQPRRAGSFAAATAGAPAASTSTSSTRVAPKAAAHARPGARARRRRRADERVGCGSIPGMGGVVRATASPCPRRDDGRGQSTGASRGSRRLVAATARPVYRSEHRATCGCSRRSRAATRTRASRLSNMQLPPIGDAPDALAHGPHARARGPAAERERLRAPSPHASPATAGSRRPRSRPRRPPTTSTAHARLLVARGLRADRVAPLRGRRRGAVRPGRLRDALAGRTAPTAASTSGSTPRTTPRAMRRPASSSASNGCAGRSASRKCASCAA